MVFVQKSFLIKRGFIVIRMALLTLFFAGSIGMVDQATRVKEELSYVSYAKDTVVDVFSTLACAIIFPFSQTRFDPKELTSTGEANKDIPIILVHGYMHNSSGMFKLRKKLNAEGFNNVFTVDMGVIPWTKSIEDFAEVLEQRIDHLAKAQKIKEMRLIGHSMGGVVCAHYAIRMAEKNCIRVRDVITLGSPLRGTRVTVLGLGRCARQMSFESEFITKLNFEIENSPIRFHHIGSKTDLLMRPYHTALNGQGGQLSRKHLINIGHVSYLFSSQVSSKVVEILESK